jgi:hypothetical protein
MSKLVSDFSSVVSNLPVNMPVNNNVPPPPPPPPPGPNAVIKTRISIYKSKQKLKKIHWDTIVNDENTVWAQMKHSLIENQLNDSGIFKAIDKHFTARVPKEITGMKPESPSSGTKILDKKRAQNISYCFSNPSDIFRKCAQY